MKKQTVFKSGKMYVFFAVVCVLLLGSCAQGYDSPDGFDVGVNNQQLKTPAADSIRFVVNSDVTQGIISWPLVLGAKGYEVTFENVDNPDSVYVIKNYSNKLVDGSRMIIPVTEDSKYRLTIRTIGDPKRGNTDDPESVVVNLSTLVPSIATIPDGSDIYEFMQNLQLNDTTFGKTPNEVAIELAPGGKYTLSGPVDFGGQKLTFRGDKVKRSEVKVTGTGGFLTYSGLKLKFINFDMAESTGTSLISMTPKASLPESIKSQNLGYLNNGAAINNIYIVKDPIYIANCWFKDMPNAMLWGNNVDCAYWYFTIDNCIIQMKNTGNNPFVHLYSSTNGGRIIKNISFSNSTFYNTTDCSAYFMRYSNSSSSNVVKVFGNVNSEFASCSITFSKCTFSKTYNKGQFSNNFNGNAMTVNVDRCIFYDCYQVARRTFDLSGATKTYKFNFWFAVTNPDVAEANRKDTGGAPFASVYDPQFIGDITKSLDFTQPNGGVNFKPGEFQIITNNGGDPRWLSK